MITRRLTFLITLVVIMTTIGSAQIDLENGLVLYLPLDGIILDQSGQNHTIVSNGPEVTEGYDGLVEGAYQFDGEDDFMVVANNEILDFDTNTPFAISLWVKADPNDDTGDIISKWNSADLNDPYSFAVRITSTNAASPGAISVARFDTNNGSCNGPSVFNAGDNLFDDLWHHVVYQLSDDNLLQVYVDNVLKNQMEDGSICSLLSESNIMIGVRSIENPSSTKPFKGSLDEIRIYNRALTNEEIGKLYDPTTSTVDFDQTIDISIFPNPVSSRINVQNNTGEVIRQNTILDYTGKKLLQFSGNTHDINMLNGMYILITEFEDGRKTTNTFSIQN